MFLAELAIEQPVSARILLAHLLSGVAAFIIRVHFVALESLVRQFGSEHEIQFLVGSPLGLRHSEKGPNQRQESRDKPEIPSLAFPIPCCGIHHVRFNNISDDLRNVICVSGQDDGLGIGDV